MSSTGQAVDTSPRTVFRTKRRYAMEGLDGVLRDPPQANRFRKLDDRGEARLIALACSDAPYGRDHWTLRLFADKLVKLCVAESLSYETVRLRLTIHLQALAKATVVHRPDERGIGGRRLSRRVRGPHGPGQPRIKYRAGSEHPPYGVVLRNLPGGRGPTHRETLEFHHTPKHVSWLNMGGIEFSALSRACLKGRNPDADALERAITAYETPRNTACVLINWRFSTDYARTKLHHFYPCLANLD